MSKSTKSESRKTIKTIKSDPQLDLSLESNKTSSDTKVRPDSPAKVAAPRVSAFNELGFQATIELLHEEIRNLYIADNIPWIIGYSGGKDSTATLQLVWTAILALPADQRKKIIYVISTDTLVENPIVAAWVTKSLEVMKTSAEAQTAPFLPQRLTPTLSDSYWVNLLGKGYPAPRHKFRWCTYRLKIQPSNSFINSIVSTSGEAILILGTRKAESSSRAANMTKHEKGRERDRLSPNSSLPGSLVYTPIEDWSNDDVWFYLMQVKNPWGYNNRDLLGMYAGATADGECPLVLDTSTPSCGDSRFGCWVCTLVEADKSMTAMIHNDVEKEWMMPLLELRNMIDFRKTIEGEYSENSDRQLRDFRRMAGHVQMMASGKEVPGPYLQTTREEWLRKLLSAQSHIHNRGSSEFQDVNLITIDELQEIRRIWVVDKHELEDSLPRIYREVTGQDYPGRPLNDNLVLGELEMQILKELCGEDQLHYELARELLSITQQQRATVRRSGLIDQLEKAFRRHYYDNREDALSRAQRMADERYSIEVERRERFSTTLMEDSKPYGLENGQ